MSDHNDIPDPHEDDLADQIRREADKERQRAKGNSKKKPKPDREKKPLRRKVNAPANFPVAAMGEYLAALTLAIVRITRVSLEAAAMVLLSAINMAVQGMANLSLPHGCKPISLFLLIAMDSGERKSTLFNLVFKSLQEFEEELWEVYRAVAVEAAKDKDAGIEVPPQPLIVVAEATIDGLLKAVSFCRGTLLCATDEAALFVGGYSMGAKDLLRSCAAYSQLWDGANITMARAATECRIIRGKRTAICLMGQPEALMGFLTNHQIQGQGLLGRFLTALPEGMVGYRPYAMPSEDAILLVEDFHLYMADLLRMPLPIKEGTQAVLNPRPLSLTSGGFDQYVQYHDEVEAQCVEGGKYFSVREAAAKSAEQALRLAATIALFEDPDIAKLNNTAVKRGIELARYFLDEALRISTSEGDPDLLLCEKTLKWIHKWSKKKDRDVISLTEMYRNGPNELRNAERARKIADILAEHNYLEKIEGGAEIDGQLREAYAIL